jgi:hypothetical protein
MATITASRNSIRCFRGMIMSEAVRVTNRTREPADRRGKCDTSMTVSNSSLSSYQKPTQERYPCICRDGLQVARSDRRERSRMCRR